MWDGIPAVISASGAASTSCDFRLRAWSMSTWRMTRAAVCRKCWRSFHDAPSHFERRRYASLTSAVVCSV